MKQIYLSLRLAVIAVPLALVGLTRAAEKPSAEITVDERISSFPAIS